MSTSAFRARAVRFSQRLRRRPESTLAVALGCLFWVFSCRPAPPLLPPPPSRAPAHPPWAQLRADQPIGRIAFGSCNHQAHPQPIWDAITAFRPDLLLLLGDNIYADTEDMTLLRAKYEQLNQVANFAALRRRVPLVATWDDHDFGRNDAGAEYPKKAESQTAFLDFLDEPAASPRRQRPGVYDAVIVGSPGHRVQLLVLDTRTFRTPLVKTENPPPGFGPYGPQTAPGATLLGETQWRWLAGELQKPADLRVLLSSIQLLPDEHGYEKWMNLPAEQQRLFRLLGNLHVQNLVVLSGDRHFAELSRLEKGPAGVPLYEMTSSPLNDQGTNQTGTNRWRIGEPISVPNFGTLDVDWSTPGPNVTLGLRDDQGHVLLSQRVSFAPTDSTKSPAVEEPAHR